MKLSQRIASPTPPFFKKLRNFGVILAAVSAAVIAAPVALPALIVQIAGYLGVAAGAISAISQTVTENEN